MVDSLPLIPSKGGACGDARPVLRDVFCELPPLAPLPAASPARLGSPAGQWCAALRRREEDLRRERARRLACPQPHNKFSQRPPTYPCYPPCKQPCKSPPCLGTCALKGPGPLRRDDLMPAIDQLATWDTSLWVGNTLSGDEYAPLMIVRELSPRSPEFGRTQQQLAVTSQCETATSVSYCELPEVWGPPPQYPPPLIISPSPAFVACIPQRIEFADFTVGKLHLSDLRVVNISSIAVRLSLILPAHRELNVELTGARGLTVTSGAATDLRIHFIPLDVRPLQDELIVRVSEGCDVIVPVSCYVRPPVLHVQVPALMQVAGSSSRISIEALGSAHPGDLLDLGARLVGAVHVSRVMFRCCNNRVNFFLMTEEDWHGHSMSSVTESGALWLGDEDKWGVWPVAWRGGGVTSGTVCCIAQGPGLRTTALRVLSSTAIARPLSFLADSVMYRPDHVYIQAQPQDYDILSAEDRQCHCYVHLGTVYPGSLIRGTVLLINNSPIDYHYYWKLRPWGVCSCWEAERAHGNDEDNDDLCEGAAEAHTQGGAISQAEIAANAVKVEALQGVLAARASCIVHIKVPNVGYTLGTQRAALVLILCDVPEKSFPSDWIPDVVRRREVPPPLAPGLHLPQIDTCDVVCAQLEVWWHVAPLRFMLDPPMIWLPYSRRVHTLELLVRATQLFGGEGARAVWRLPALSQKPPPLVLTPAYSTAAALCLPLTAPPDDRSVSEVLSLEAEGGEWVAKCVLNRVAYTRHPKLRPTLRWLGYVAPGARLATAITVTNDTHTSAWWAAHAWRWLGERPVGPACVGRVPCAKCQQRTCTCHILHPTRAHHLPGEEHHIHYEVTAPDHDGCVATLVSLVRAMADQRIDNQGEGTLAGTVACEGRAALVTYRVLAPRLVLRVYPCGGVTAEVPECRPCTLDSSDGRVLRPTSTLTLGRRTCYRLRLTNITPLPTRVRWLAPPNKEEDLKIIFIPNDYDVGSYAKVEIKVVVEALRVSKRHVWVRSAYVERAYTPIYLLVDAAVSGMEVELEWPLGGDKKADAFAFLRRTQRPGDDGRRIIAPEKAFAEEDIRSAYVRRNICYCRCQNVYIEPEKPPPQDPNIVPLTIPIVTEPPPLTRVCACFDAGGVPWRTTAHGQPACIQLWNMPVHKVEQRVLVLRNTSTLSARWSASVRLWPRKKVLAPAADPWVTGIGPCGVAIHLNPSSGRLGANARIEIQLSAYADTWGVYRDEVLFQVDHLEPFIVTVWLHAVGSPLELALLGRSPPSPSINCRDISSEPTMWISPSDEKRIVRARNTSHADVLVRAYVVTNYERPSEALPFRLYYRLIDIPPRECECTDPHHYCVEEEQEVEEDVEPGTGFELYFGDDFGMQSSDYRVVPEVQTVLAGHAAEWYIVPPSEPRVPSTLIMRASALTIAENDWRRTEPAPVWLRLQIAEREGSLCVLRDELRIEVSALTPPNGVVMRVRKRVAVMNSGNGWLSVLVRTCEPWSVVEGARRNGQCSTRCGPRTPGNRRQEMTMKLAPHSITTVCVEVRVPANAAWPSHSQPKLPSFLNPISSVTSPSLPATSSSYPEWREYCDKLIFYDDDDGDTNILCELPLILWLELPRISVVPQTLDFGYVWDGETRKSYCEVSHTSRRETLWFHVMWDGDEDFTVRPSYLRIPPGEKERLTVRYRARWKPSPAEGTVLIRAPSNGAAWCCARIQVRAAPSRDFKCRLPPHDYTIDTSLLPQ